MPTRNNRTASSIRVKGMSWSRATRVISGMDRRLSPPAASANRWNTSWRCGGVSSCRAGIGVRIRRAKSSSCAAVAWGTEMVRTSGRRTNQAGRSLGWSSSQNTVGYRSALWGPFNRCGATREACASAITITEWRLPSWTFPPGASLAAPEIRSAHGGSGAIIAASTARSCPAAASMFPFGGCMGAVTLRPRAVASCRGCRSPERGLSPSTGSKAATAGNPAAVRTWHSACRVSR